MAVERIKGIVQRQGPFTLPHGAGSGIADVLDSAWLGIKTGVLVYYDYTNGVIKPANSYTWTTSKLVTQKLFADQFVGILNGDVDRADAAGTRSIANEGAFLLTCTAGTYKPGDLLGVAKQAGGNALCMGTVEKVTHPAAAIAKVIRPSTYDSSGNVTEVVATLMPRFLNCGHTPTPRMSTLCFATLDVTGDILTDYTVGRPFAVFGADFINTVVQASADKVFEIHKGATALVTSPVAFTVATSGSAVGKVTHVDIDPTLAANKFASNDTLSIVDDGGGTGGGGYMHIHILEL